jgi:hypothetical protein
VKRVETKGRITAAERRRADLLERAEKRRHEIAVALDSSQEVLARARAFTRKYEGVTAERAEAQSFWNDLLAVFEINRRAVGALFDHPARRVDTGGNGFVDFFWPGVLLAEHKSAGKDFTSALAQADAYELSPGEAPRLTVVCDFARFLLRDNHTGRSIEFDLKDFPNRLGWFGPLVKDELTELAPQRPVDVKAAETMAGLHDELRAAGYSGHNLRVLMTRLLFCFFADDAQIWPHGKFDSYLRATPAALAGPALAQLFDVLNTPVAERSSLLDASLATFPYVNGGLFAEVLPIVSLSQELLDVLIPASEDIDWSAVSPAVFGAMFQGVMDAQERRDLGAHYTSEENILRVIEPLFLDDLYGRIEGATTVPELEAIWEEMSQMVLLDPAAGCGNFLVVAYRELRRAERRLMDRLRELARDDARYAKRFPWVSGQRYIDSSAASRLSVSQFHGFEIEEWPAQIALVAMWLTDHLANMELEEQFGGHQTRLPLLESARVVVGNALRLDWLEAMGVQATHVIGNPPFLGRHLRDDEQNTDMQLIWGKTRGAGNIDYVTCWFKKAADYVDGTDTRVALVATNSISQGEQPAVLWSYLYDADMHIDFAHRPFNWTNEARGRAAVHVVIVGFSQGRKGGTKTIWEYPDINAAGIPIEVETINPYLAGGPEILVSSRTRPLVSSAQQMRFGSMPHDGGHLLLSPAEAAEVRENDPIAAPYLRPLIGAQELIQGRERWCLWLPDASPEDIRRSPSIRERAAEVKAVRLASPDPSAVSAAATPTLFKYDRQPKSRYLAVPRVSSERREYLPLAFREPIVIATDALLTIDEATTATFALMASKVFTVWNKSVSGRLKSDCRISAEITYNNFPWAAMTDAQRSELEAAAQGVLDARAAHPTATLADLYDPLSMPKDLTLAHRRLDRTVMSLYGLGSAATDADVLTALFARYLELTS